MSRGLTIANFVQQVLYAMYKVRLDVRAGVEGSFHCHSDKFKEVVMEGNFVLQELQKEQDWQFLRDRWEMGVSRNPPAYDHHGHRYGTGIQEFHLPDDVYKVCTGYNDAVRLHHRGNPIAEMQVLFEEARSGNIQVTDMFDEWGALNVDKQEQRAFTVGDIVTFNRPWFRSETGLVVETDVIRYIEPMHICDEDCPDECPLAYEDRLFTWLPDPYYLVVRTAAKRALADPLCADTAQSLVDESTKFLSAMRENDSSHTTTDTYETGVLGYIQVL